MSIEFNIARRLSSRKGGAKVGVMERVATIATAVSVAVIIITLSVVVGFKHDLYSLLSGAWADITITAPQSRGVVSGVRLERCPELDAVLGDEAIESYTPYMAKEGVLKSDDNILGVLLKGVDTLYAQDFYAERIAEGSFPRVGENPRTKEILISKRMADKMNVERDDRVEMVFVDGDGGLLRDRFVVSGIYHTGVDVIDDGIVLTDMRNVSRLYDGNPNMITGYELRLHDNADSFDAVQRLNLKLIELYEQTGIDAEAFTERQIFPDIFGWLATHDVTAMAIIVIMIVVALLNMTTSLLIIVLERQRMIGELRALGMRRQSIVRVFLFRALFIMGRGMVAGTLLGVALVVIQHIWHIVPLPSEGYLLEAVPAALCWGWWMVAIVGVAVVTLVVMLLPAAFSARISPAEIMRYE